MLLLPAVLTIALFEEDLPAMAFGIVGGLFCDFGLSGVLASTPCFWQCCAIWSAISAAPFPDQPAHAWSPASGPSPGGAGPVVFLYYFSYSYPGYAFTHHYLPKYCYTMLFVPLLYLLNRALSQALQPPER